MDARGRERRDTGRAVDEVTRDRAITVVLLEAMLLRDATVLDMEERGSMMGDEEWYTVSNRWT